MSRDTYTQREWDRTVGYGSVPDKYKEKSEVKPNTQFKLSVKDLEIIETCLRYRQASADDKEKVKINKLLGKIHTQKNWYRPKGVYVSG